METLFAAVLLLNVSAVRWRCNREFPLSFSFLHRSEAAGHREKPVHWPDEPMQVVQSKECLPPVPVSLFQWGLLLLPVQHWLLDLICLLTFPEILPQEISTGSAPSKTSGNLCGAVVGRSDRLHHWRRHQGEERSALTLYLIHTVTKFVIGSQILINVEY